MIESVCVYTGASSRVDQSYKDAAAELGRLIARQNWRMVYGGGGVGLMGITAETALKAGAKVTGIIPKFLNTRERGLEDITELHLVATMHERKQMMVERADAFIVMPGGCGTMDEFFEILTWRQLDLHDKPIIVVNLNHYWTPLLAMLDHMVQEQFLRPDQAAFVTVVDAVDGIVRALTRHGAVDPEVQSELI